MIFVALTPDEGAIPIHLSFAEFAYQPPQERHAIGLLLWLFFGVSSVGAGVGLLWRATGRRWPRTLAVGSMAFAIFALVDIWTCATHRLTDEQTPSKSNGSTPPTNSGPK